MAEKYVIIAMGRKEKMHGGNGKNEASAIMKPGGKYPLGYLPITGVWDPVSLHVELFDDEASLDKYLASDAGRALADDVAIAIKVRLEDKPAKPPQGTKPQPA